MRYSNGWASMRALFLEVRRKMHTPDLADKGQPELLSPLTGASECGEWLRDAAIRARIAADVLRKSSNADRTAALRHAARKLRISTSDILDANEADLRSYRGTESFRDRLALDADRIESMAISLETVAILPDPLHRTIESWTRPNGLRVETVAAPIGVIGMIYESRPNVGVDAASLCIKSGNAVLLRGGSESRATAAALNAAIVTGLADAGLPTAAVQVIPTADRAMVGAMLAASGLIDLIIPRGSRSLVERVQREARIPVLAHAEGICHTFVHEGAEIGMAIDILANAKLRRTSVCGATETLLIDVGVAQKWLPTIVEEMAARGCAFRGDRRVHEILPHVPIGTEADFRTEWQDAILSIAVVDGVEDAIYHIRKYGSGHTDAIVTQDEAAARHFLANVDSAVTLWNASTQFSDGGEFGFGAEIGIATGRLHARGPIGASQLTVPRFNVIGTGQVRP